MTTTATTIQTSNYDLRLDGTGKKFFDLTDDEAELFYAELKRARADADSDPEPLIGVVTPPSEPNEKQE